MMQEIAESEAEELNCKKAKWTKRDK